jgi:hypothetical protein
MGCGLCQNKRGQGIGSDGDWHRAGLQGLCGNKTTASVAASDGIKRQTKGTKRHSWQACKNPTWSDIG